MFAASYSQSSDAEEVLPMFGLSDLALGVAEAEESEEFDDDVDGDSDPSKRKRIRQPPREPVICEVCHKQFTRKAHLVRHMYLHTGEKPFKCNLCTQSFNRKDHLRSHMKGHADSKFKCNHCPLTFPKSDLLRVHVLKNHGKYQKTFKAPSSSGPAPIPADHETSETPKLGFKVLTCRFCGMKFTQSQAYNRHVASHKRGQVAGAEKIESDNEEIVDENENERDLAQKHVETAMSSDEGVEDDQDRQEGDEVSEKDDGDSSQDGGLEIDTGEDEDDLREDENDDGSEHQGDRSDLDPPRKMECVVCGKDNFSDQRALRRHYKVHKRRFICRFCGIKMSSAGSLMRHNMLHTGEKPFKCDKCNRKFSRKDALKAHLVAHEKDNVKHALPRPFVCTKCSASYTMRYNLIRHMRQCHHSVNRSQNGAAGGRPTPIKNVQEEQHGDTDESNIPVIDSTNESGGHQKITINPNDPLRCMHCNKVFSTMKSLSTHIWYHNQDRRFICKVCQRAFKYATDLHRHEMTHNTAGKRGVSITQQRAQNRLALARQQTKVTAVAHRAPPNHSSIVVNGQRRYPCEYCTVIFNHRSNRSRHVRIFHADQQQQVQQGRTGFPPVQQRLQIKPSLQQQRQLIASKQALLRRQTTVAAIPFNRRRPQPVSRNQLNLKPNQANAIMQAQQLQIRQARQSIESIDADDCEPNFNGNMFKCDLCDKVFDKRYNYKLHLRTHNKQFSCIVCGLKTASQGDLTLHIRTHTGEKPFKCSYPSCEWKFARRSALTVHYRRHHGPNAKIKRQYNPQRITPNMMQSGSEGGSPAVEVAGSPGGPDNSILKTMLENFPCKEEIPEEMEEEPKPVPTPVKVKKNLPPPPPLIRYPIPASMMTKKEIVAAPMEEEKKMSPEVVFFCKPCQRLISGKDNYVDHMLEMHGTTVTAIDSTPVNRPSSSPSSSKKMIPPTLLKRPLGIPQPSVYTCHTCGEVFGSRHDFTVHNLITHCYGTGKFKCGLCQVSVTDLAFLARHYQYVHPRAKNAGEEARLMIANTIAQDDEMDYDDNMHDVGDAAADMLLYPEVEVVVKEEELEQPSQNFESEGDQSLTPTDTASQSSQQGTSPVVRKPVPGIMPVDPNLPFPCPLCNKGFKDKKALADHKWYHSREAIYPCTVSGCDKRFKLKNDLIRHLRRHLQTRPFACTEPGCESRFYQNSDLSRHLNKVHNQHETAAFSCDHCSGSFTRPELLVRHMKNSHPTEDVSHLLLVQMHEKKKRDEEKQVQDFLANLPPEEEEEEAPPAEPEWSQDHDLDYSFELQQLEIDAFDNEDDLTYHDSQNPTRRQFNSPSKGINNTTMMEKLANENGVLENGPPYACQNCSKVFEDRQKFIYHRYYHLRDYRYTCPEEGCGEKFKIKGHVERHIKTYHNSEKPVRNVFHCPITGCSRKFTREYDLSNHIDRMHNGPSGEVNNEANYEEMVQMLEFENTSQDEENAEETFEQEVNPEYFEQVEQYETKPFVKSPSPPASSSILQPCMNKLEEYTNDKGELFCKACNKHFKDLKTLQNHVYYHQRESKHKCEECGAKFKQKSDLRRHMSIHHDPNKKRQCIPCPNCNRSFTHERYLNIHLNKECDGGAKDTAQETNEQDQNQEEEWFPLNPQIDIEEVDETNGEQEQVWNDEVEQPDPLMFVSNDVQGDNEEYNNEEYGEEEDEGYDKGHHTQQQNVFECDMCDTFFSRSNELILHRRSVHSEAGMSSPPKSRNTPPSSQSTKGKVKTFTCNKCGMSFMQKAELTQHLQQYHLDELPIHQCQFCPKYFYVKKSLDTHRRRHHSHLLNLIACQICGMKFQAKEYLVSHMKSHHQIN